MHCEQREESKRFGKAGNAEESKGAKVAGYFALTYVACGKYKKEGTDEQAFTLAALGPYVHKIPHLNTERVTKPRRATRSVEHHIQSILVTLAFVKSPE